MIPLRVAITIYLSATNSRTRQKAVIFSPFADRTHIDDRFPLGQPAADRNLVHFHPVAPSLVGEEQDIVVGRGDKEMFGEIFFLGFDTDHASSAALLAAIQRDRQPFDISEVRDGDHHVFFGDQIFDRQFLGGILNFGAAVVAVFLLPVPSVSSLMICIRQRFGFQNRLSSLIFLISSRYSSSIFCRSRPVSRCQPHFENGVGLNLGQLEFLHQAFAGGREYLSIS